MATGVCNTCFNWTPKLVREFCPSCYHKDWQNNTRGRLKRKPKVTHCKGCNADLTVVGYYSQMCKSCYEKDRQTKKECMVCKVKFPRGSVYATCRDCRDSKKGTDGLGFLVKGLDITPEIRSFIRINLVKFRRGYYNALDVYKVVDMYSSLFEYEKNLDIQSELDQAITMLKRMEKLIK